MIDKMLLIFPGFNSCIHRIRKCYVWMVLSVFGRLHQFARPSASFPASTDFICGAAHPRENGVCMDKVAISVERWGLQYVFLGTMYKLYQVIVWLITEYAGAVSEITFGIRREPGFVSEYGRSDVGAGTLRAYYNDLLFAEEGGVITHAIKIANNSVLFFV